MLEMNVTQNVAALARLLSVCPLTVTVTSPISKNWVMSFNKLMMTATSTVVFYLKYTYIYIHT